MKERPILFSTPMVQAILDGRKTMTRRVVTNLDLIQDWDKNDPAYGPFYADEYGDYHETAGRCPYGLPGDLLWVRETWRKPEPHEYDAPVQIEFKAGHCQADELKWKPSIHMPKAYARIWLKVTGIRVERLQEITGPDALAEGIKETQDMFMMKRGWGVAKEDGSTARDAFQHLWDFINSGRGYGWDKNPWVWVVEFEQTEKPEKEE